VPVNADSWPVICFTAAHTAQAGTNVWTSNGPEGGNVSALAVDSRNPETVYAGTYSGVFKSTDGGTSWINTGQPFSRALAVDPVNPGTVYVGGAGGVFKSTDGGLSWTAMSAGLPPTSVQTLAIDPVRPATVYAGTYCCEGKSGFFKSSDGGASWTAITTLPAGNVYTLAIDPTNPATLYAFIAGSELGIFKSTDGVSWAAASTGLPPGAFIGALAIDPETPTTLYAGTTGGYGGTTGAQGVFKSTDGGTSWAQAIPDLDVRALAIDPATPTTVYAGTSAGVFRSIDGGTSWVQTRADLDVDGLAIDPATPTTVYAGTSVGVFKTTDGGTSWTGMNAGLIATSVRTLATGPGTPTSVYAATDVPGGVFKSIDAGVSWTVINTGLADVLVNDLAADPTNPGSVYAGMQNHGVFKTTDGGVSWTAANVGFPATSVNTLAVDPSDTANVYAGTARGVFKSTDGGVSWAATAVIDGLPYIPVVTALAIDPGNSATVYAGIGVGGSSPASTNLPVIAKSTDGGANWTAIEIGLFSFGNGSGAIECGFFVQATALVVDPVAPDRLYVALDGIDCGHRLGGVFKSTDGGNTWGALDIRLPPAEGVTALVIDPATPTTLYVGVCGLNWTFDTHGSPQVVCHGGNATGVYQSTDAGATWNAFNTGLSSGDVHAIAIDPITPTRFYVGTQGGGVFSIQQVAACTGDCNRNGTVTVDELMTGVRIALTSASINSCPEFACRGTNQVSVDCLVQGVDAALNTCVPR
jgi:photosystem II stability/assembly factor-like uncharacterized protein